MENRFLRTLSFGKRALLASVAILAVTGPVVVGLMNPPRGRAQSQAHEEFEVASVKLSPPGFTNGMRTYLPPSGGPGTADPGLLRCVNCSLSDLVIKAYNLETYQLSGPGWLVQEARDPIRGSHGNEFLLSAKVPAGATEDQARLMLQSLLAERFKLKVHWEKKDMPAWALVAGKGGPKLKESAETGPQQTPEEHPHITMNRDLFSVIPPGYPANGIVTFSNGHILFSTGAGRATMGMLAQELMRKLEEPVADETGLKGRYDFTLYWAKEQPDPSWPPERLPPPEDLPLPTLSQALHTLGLDVERKTVPSDVLVVDHAEKVPTEN
jgi:uncharacterized protein (TIGR03435 family)